MCRVWQHSFKTRQTLHIEYDASRSADCAGCDYCVTQCFIDLDPRSTDVFDSCINCGECVDACHRMHRKEGTPGLLRFAFGERAASAARHADRRNNEYSLFGRARWALPFTVLGLVMFGWGLWTYEPYHVSVDHGSASAGRNVTDYQIAVANKRYVDGKVQLRVTGIDADKVHLSTQDLALGKVEHRTLTLSISPELPHGLYRVQVEVRSADGWVGHASFQHLAG